ncbi:MAG: tRNA lysidine(34) synthetase TilS [Lachnospiraceae bacterium]|nr:tRNA lysidine(34) synthetase TilS [Lachnospiraceae bacterium]
MFFSCDHVMNTLIAEVHKYCKKHELIAPGDGVLIGLSGGMDSVCLFDVLLKLRSVIGFELTALHVEHGIRGEASVSDMEFVKKLCEEKGIRLIVYNEDVPAYAKKEKLTLEEAARILRYRDFEKALKELSAQRIAVAHHMNDQAETVLFNMIRGTSISGMAGMSPKRDHIIRPLLFLSREEIEEYVKENGLSYVNDETNADKEYSRNRIRHLIIPEMEKVVKGAAGHIAREAAELSLICEHIDKEAEKLCERGLREEPEGSGRFLLCISELKAESVITGRAAIKRVLSLMCGKWKDISARNIEDIYDLTDNISGKGVDIPYGIRVKRTGDRLLFERSEKPDGQECGSAEMLCLQGRQTLSDGTVTECRIFDKDDPSYPQNDYTKWFDYDKIVCGQPPEIRTGRKEDRIVINKEGGHQSLNRYFINNRIPSDKRPGVKLIAKGNDIVWIIGGRISESYKITSETKRVIEIRINGG